MFDWFLIVVYAAVGSLVTYICVDRWMQRRKQRPATYWSGYLLYTEAEGLCVAKVVKADEQWAVAFSGWPEKQRFETWNHAMAWAEEHWDMPR